MTILTGPLGKTALLHAVTVLCGVAQIEDLPSETVGHFENLLVFPVYINFADRDELVSTLMLSDYQAACILDWRQRNGNILGDGELSSIDGIGPATAEALSLFIRYDVTSGSTVTQRLDGRLSFKDGEVSSSKARYTFKSGGVGLNLSDEAASLSLRRRSTTVLLGDFDARFGQGLVLWSGNMFSGVGNANTFMRNPSMLKVATSFSAASKHRGLGCQWGNGSVAASLFHDLKNGVTGGGAQILLRGTSAGLAFCSSAERTAFGAHFKSTLGHITLCGEGAVEKGCPLPSVVFSASYRPLYNLTVSSIGRLYSTAFSGKWASGPAASSKTSDEAGLGLSAVYGECQITADYSYHPSNGRDQLKLVSNLQRSFTAGQWAMEPSVKVTWRKRNNDPFGKLNLRGDVSLSRGAWRICGRTEMIRYTSRAGSLSYIEGGYDNGTVSLFCRFLGHDTSCWADRLYAYMRTPPGYFSVPAYYGRGTEFAAYAVWHGKAGDFYASYRTGGKPYMYFGYSRKSVRNSFPRREGTSRRSEGRGLREKASRQD